MTALAKTPGSVWQAASITVYFCWSAADGWEPWKLQVTFRKLFISWWKCKNRLCQLLNFWGRQGLKWSLFEQRNMSTSWWIKSDLCLSLPVSFSLCLSLRFSKVFNLSSLPFSICVCVCHSLRGPQCPPGCFQPTFWWQLCQNISSVSRAEQVSVPPGSTTWLCECKWKISCRGYKRPNFSLKPWHQNCSHTQ